MCNATAPDRRCLPAARTEGGHAAPAVCPLASSRGSPRPRALPRSPWRRPHATMFSHADPPRPGMSRCATVAHGGGSLAGASGPRVRPAKITVTGDALRFTSRCVHPTGNQIAVPAPTSRVSPPASSTPLPAWMKNSSSRSSCVCRGISPPGWTVATPNEKRTGLGTFLPSGRSVRAPMIARTFEMPSGYVRSTVSSNRATTALGMGLAHLAGQVLKIPLDLCQRHDIGVLRVQVEQRHMVRDLESVEHALLHHAHAEPIRRGIDDCRPNAPARGTPGHEQGVDAALDEVREERRPEKRAGARLGQDQV